MSYLPAGYSDEGSDYDDYDDFSTDAYTRNGEAPVDEANNEGYGTGPWNHPRSLSPTTDQDIIAASKDVYTFLKLIQSNNVLAVRQCLSLVQSLVNQNYGSSSSFVTAGGSRPIFVACMEGLPEMVSLFVEFGADLSADVIDQMTPLMSVCSTLCSHSQDKDEFEKNLVECAKILLEQVDVNARQSQRLTALMFAAKQGYDSLVELLIEHKADLNLVESQSWTALTFAVDAEFGNVARRLLEAGANPDIATSDGLLPVDIADAKNNPKLVSVIQSFAKRAKITRDESGAGSGTGVQFTKFSELDNILLGLDASEYIPLFNQHGLNLETFLQLNEVDLEKIGVEKIGIRKKIGQAIVDIHKKDWEKSSLSKILPVDKQNGIYLTCPDAVLQLANMSQHFKFLSANLQFLKRHLREKPEMLLIGKDVADAHHLSNRVSEAKQNLASTTRQLREVEQALITAVKKLNLELKPADQLGPKPSSSRRKLVFFTSSGLLIASLVTLVYLVSNK